MWNIGVDIVKISRFREKPIEENLNFYKRVFTNDEIKYCTRFTHPSSHFAGTFAAKEAVFKAINQQIPVKMNEIEVMRLDGKIPKIRLVSSHKSNIDNFRVQYNGISYTIKVSISHSKTHAIAIAVVTDENEIPVDPEQIREMINEDDF